MAETLSNAEALQQVIQKAKRTRHLSKGLNECARALEQRKAVLCVLSSGVAEAAYSSLITALFSDFDKLFLNFLVIYLSFFKI